MKVQKLLKARASCPYHDHVHIIHMTSIVSIRSRSRLSMPRRGSFTCQSTLDPWQWSSSATWQSGHQWSPGDTEYPIGSRRYLHLRGCRLSIVHARSSSERHPFRREMYVYMISLAFFRAFTRQDIRSR